MIKKGDKVIITTGKDKGKSGSVERVLPKKNKAVVTGLNMSKRHIRARKEGQKGNIVDVACPIDLSNLKLAK
jgi:large subunit ribosomal protein L24